MARLEIHDVNQVLVERHRLNGDGSWVLTFTIHEEKKAEHDVVLFCTVKPDFPPDPPEIRVPLFWWCQEADNVGD